MHIFRTVLKVLFPYIIKIHVYEYFSKLYADANEAKKLSGLYCHEYHFLWLEKESKTNDMS